MGAVIVRDSGVRLHDFLKDRLIAAPVNELGDLVKSGAVLVNGKRARTDHRLTAGDELTCDLGSLPKERRITPAEIEVRVAYEDADLLVADKPAGMHVHPLGEHRDATLVNALVWRAGARPDSPWGEWRPHPAHRLDRAASGLVAIAKSAAIRDALRDAIGPAKPGRGGPGAKPLDIVKMRRVYVARVLGVVTGERGVVDAPIGRDPEFDYRRAVVPGGQRAVTRWRVVARFEGATLVECELETGRTHQIRVHLASLGHPIEGDTLYVDRTPSSSICLHAMRLELGHPRTGQPIVCESNARW